MDDATRAAHHSQLVLDRLREAFDGFQVRVHDGHRPLCRSFIVDIVKDRPPFYEPYCQKALAPAREAAVGGGISIPPSTQIGRDY